MEAHCRPIEEFDERLGQYMLSGMLLHMIRTPIGIDPATNRLAVNFSFKHMDHIPAGSILNAIDKRHVVDGSKIIGLAARCGIKGGPIQDDARPIPNGFDFNNVCVELEEVWIAVIESF